MNTKRIPSIYEVINEQLNIDIEYNQDTIESDIERLEKEVDDLYRNIKSKSELFEIGELEYNEVNDSILEYLDKKTKLDYLTLNFKIKTNNFNEVQ
jgi:hypothetical protein